MIQWYPGHMAKAKRNILKDLKLVDVVIELLDARCPETTRNPDIEQISSQKARVMLLNKADLADPLMNQAFCELYRKQGYFVMEIDARKGELKKKIASLIRKAAKPILERNHKRGIVNNTIHAMVLGVPNVGKSTFINTYVGRAMAKTGNIPGVTKGNQWINIDDNIQLLDTPGITWHKYETEETGIRLGLIGSINDNNLPSSDLALYLVSFLIDEKNGYSEALNKRYEIYNRYPNSYPAENPDTSEGGSDNKALNIIFQLGKKKSLVKKGGEIDYGRTCQMILDDFRRGLLGRITLDSVPES